jgi:hypothetical protein
MKKLVFITSLLFTLFFCFGEGEHLKFRNIEMNGNVIEFVNKLKGLDYVVKLESNEMYILNGIFIGKECKICVLITEKTKTVWGVGVYLPEHNNWKSLHAEYNLIKEQLIKRYGSVNNHIETFHPPYKEGDNNELKALENNKCVYVSYWEHKNGTIMLKISNNLVLISYYDKVNTEKSENEASEKVFDDL